MKATDNIFMFVTLGQNIWSNILNKWRIVSFCPLFFIKMLINYIKKGNGHRDDVRRLSLNIW